MRHHVWPSTEKFPDVLKGKKEKAKQKKKKAQKTTQGPEQDSDMTQGLE